MLRYPTKIQFVLTTAAHIQPNALTAQGSRCSEALPVKFHLELISAHAEGRASSAQLQVCQAPTLWPLLGIAHNVTSHFEEKYIACAILMNLRAGHNAHKSA